MIKFKKHDLTSNLNDELVKEKSNSSCKSKNTNDDLSDTNKCNNAVSNEVNKPSNNKVLINKMHGDGIICKNVTFASLTKFKEHILELDRRLD